MRSRWLGQMKSEAINLEFKDGRGSQSYTPTAAGSYIARWSVGAENFYRYFSAINDDYVVARYAGYPAIHQPSLKGTGIPIDLPLPVEQFKAGDPLYEKFLIEHRKYGSTVVAQFPDTPDLSSEERDGQYGTEMDRIQNLLPDDTT